MSRLRELREEAVLTVRELSQQSGVSEDTITKIENGHRKARPSTIRKLAKTLNVEPSDIIAPDVLTPAFGVSTSRSFKPTLKERPPVELSGTVTGRLSARGELTVEKRTVEVSLGLLWNVLEAAKGNREPDPDEIREVEKTIGAQLTDEA